MAEKDLKYYLTIIRMAEKYFTKLPDGQYQLAMKLLPNIVGVGIGSHGAERDFLAKAEGWVKYALENNVEVFPEINKETKKKVEIKLIEPLPCPFCGGNDIEVDIDYGKALVGCEYCGYKILVGQISFSRKLPVEQQAIKLWNNCRPIEKELRKEIAELKSRLQDKGREGGLE